jgi:hypothetical protein
VDVKQDVENRDARSLLAFFPTTTPLLSLATFIATRHTADPTCKSVVQELERSSLFTEESVDCVIFGDDSFLCIDPCIIDVSILA